MSEESKFAFQREKGIEAGTVAAKSFAALCANADALRLGAWLAIVKNNLESAKAVMRAKGVSTGAIAAWEDAVLSVVAPTIVGEIGRLKALALFAAVGLPTAEIDKATGPSPKAEPSHLRVVK
jgi:hypothetical protein